ncbi:hypothetical protein KIH31_15420 [Paenarthrobacter sp. DKR-5]|uniref:hypothetical protein n=1 Tax=Paenarthrobacter sp. DKR-5 TaxID=2835535 RepID=UPI001BDC85B2|nr:hypothetical protein [Paenarthrobacter sp. DKR-5]MBT1003978.1 hypothetical protein [Paenarthrobacter sp. DKR-5]
MSAMIENVTSAGNLTSSRSSAPISVAREAFCNAEVPKNLTLDILTTSIEKMRGARIKILSAPMLTATRVCGLWVPREKLDVILVAPTPWRLQYEQYVLHELAHMILGHDRLAGGIAGLPSDLFAELPDHVVARALARHDFRTAEEQAAEHLADLLAEAIRNSPTEPASFEQVFG